MNGFFQGRAAGFALACIAALAGPHANAAEYMERPIMPLDQVPEMTNALPHPEWRHWWIFDISPRISAQTLHDDNINIQSGPSKQEDFIFAASPGFRAVAGERLEENARLLSISYSPTFIKFADHSQYDAIDHSGSIYGIWPFSRLILGFSQTYDRTSGGVVDVGNRVERETYNTGLTSSYELSEKTSFEINARQSISDYPPPLLGTREWLNDDWINYLAAAKLTLGAGFTFGHVELDQSPSQEYERLLLRAAYHLTYKVDVTASVGGELRHYQDRDKLGAIFSVGASYWPREGTTLSVEGHRDNRNSALLPGQNYISTGLSATIRQRLIERVYMSLNGSYENAKYESAIMGVAASRCEDYYLVHASADVVLTQRWLAGLFFRHRENVSNISGFSFDNNQYGIQTSYQF